MKPGPNKVIECPHCGTLHKYGTLLSGNTFRGRVWTDGYAFYPMLPAVPEVTKCSKCDYIFFLRAAVAVGEYDQWRWPPRQAERSVPQEWYEAPDIVFMSTDDYYLALSKQLYSDRGEEMYLCQMAWHTTNHQLRQLPVTSRTATLFRTPNKPTATQENVVVASSTTVKILDRLLALLDEQVPDERILKAEALRELGRLEEALVILKDPFPEKLQELASFIRSLAEQGLFQVMELPRNQQTVLNER